VLVIDSKVTAGFASQPSLVSSVAVIWTSLWFGDQRVSGDSETRDVGEHSGGDTVSVAGLLVALPAELLTTYPELRTIVLRGCGRSGVARQGSPVDVPRHLLPLIAQGAVPEAVTENVAV